MQPKIRAVPGTLDIHRLDGTADIPQTLLRAPWTWISRTGDELSIVCPPDEQLAATAEVSAGWSALQVEGPIEHTVVGLLAHLSGVLAAERITIFALSTFDTDYVLVREAERDRALAVLERAGYPVEAAPASIRDSSVR